MAHRNTIRAGKLRREMIAELGGVCVHCGAVHDLEFDHIKPRAYSVRKLSYLQRINRYRVEMVEGKIQLLCGACNTLKHLNGNELPPHPGPLPRAEREKSEEDRRRAVLTTNGEGDEPF